jgi:glycosyltransferase (activator-dependent family)
MTPLAWALRTAGHQVRMAGAPDLAEDIARAGHTGISVGEPMAEALAKVDEELEPPKAERPTFADGEVPVQGDYARDDQYGELAYLSGNLLNHIIPDAMLDDLVNFAREWEPDLVIWDQMCPVGAVVARASGAAHARFLWGTDTLIQLRQATLHQGDPMREWLSDKLARYNCEFDEEIVTGQWTIDTTPSWMWHPQAIRYLPVRHIPFNGPATVADWLYEKPARRRVCMTLGVTMRQANLAEAAAGNLFDAVADLDVEVIATLNQDQIDPGVKVPGNVRVADFAPMNVLMPTCSAVIHHGGAGTFASALEHGVPQLIVPSAYWTAMWYGPVAMANALAREGAGLYVAADSDHLTVEALRESVSRVLSDSAFSANAARLREETLATPTPNDIVPALEKLTANHRGIR